MARREVPADQPMKKLLEELGLDFLVPDPLGMAFTGKVIKGGAKVGKRTIQEMIDRASSRAKRLTKKGGDKAFLGKARQDLLDLVEKLLDQAELRTAFQKRAGKALSSPLELRFQNLQKGVSSGGPG